MLCIEGDKNQDTLCTEAHKSVVGQRLPADSQSQVAHNLPLLLDHRELLLLHSIFDESMILSWDSCWEEMVWSAAVFSAMSSGQHASRSAKHKLRKRKSVYNANVERIHSLMPHVFRKIGETKYL